MGSDPNVGPNAPEPETPKVYTILAYKEDSTNYDGDRRWHSDLQVEFFETFQAAVECAAKWLEWKGERDEDGYDVRVLVNGKESEWSDDDIELIIAALLKDARAIVQAHKKEQEERAARAAASRAQREAAEKAAWTKEQERLKEVRDREEYARLKAKFEGGNDVKEESTTQGPAGPCPSSHRA